jgi:hypothetical protein
MARYIKANPKVAVFLGLERDRNTVKDGNYLLWQADMLAFGPLTQLTDTLTQIGGIALLPHEARQEQDGTVTRPLPVATDPRFIIETQEPEETTPVDDDNDEPVQESAPEAESPAETEETAPAEEPEDDNQEPANDD